MNQNKSESLGYNRRDFLKGGSAVTLMTMLGGVELFAQASADDMYNAITLLTDRLKRQLEKHRKMQLDFVPLEILAT